MPRGRKKKEILTVDQKIMKVEGEIQELNETLKAKRAELKALQKEKESEDKQVLLEAIKESGKSIDEILEMLKN